MNSLKAVIATVALVAFTSPAYAAVTITTNFTPNSTATPLQIFQDFTNFTPPDIGTPGNNVPAGNGTTQYNPNPVLGEVVSGFARVFTQDTPGQALGPIPFSGNFMAVGGSSGAGSYSVLLTGLQVFSFAFGGLGPSDRLTLSFANSPDVVLTSTQICGTSLACTNPVNGPNGPFATGRVTYDIGGTDVFRMATFSAPGAAFEFTDLAGAAPEPAAWALMILGFGIVGSALRRRRRTQVRFNFA